MLFSFVFLRESFFVFCFPYIFNFYNFFIVEHILEYVFNCVKRSDKNKLIAAVFMFVINISCVVSK